MFTLSELQVSELRKLDIMFTFDETPATTEAVKKIAAEVTRLPISGHCLVTGDLLPATHSDPFFLWFHIDQNDSDKRDKLFFCHMAFSIRPTKPPPAAMSNLHTRGITIEWLLAALAGAAKTPSESILADAEIRIGEPEKEQIKLPPMKVGDNILLPCGVEYKTQESVKEGVYELRWSDRRQKHRSVWLHYKTSWNWSVPWHEEKQRCLRYLTDAI